MGHCPHPSTTSSFWLNLVHVVGVSKNSTLKHCGLYSGLSVLPSVLVPVAGILTNCGSALALTRYLMPCFSCLPACLLIRCGTGEKKKKKKKHLTVPLQRFAVRDTAQVRNAGAVSWRTFKHARYARASPRRFSTARLRTPRGRARLFARHTSAGTSRTTFRAV